MEGPDQCCGQLGVATRGDLEDQALPLDASYNFRVGDALSFTAPYSELANDPMVAVEGLVFYQTERE